MPNVIFWPHYTVKVPLCGYRNNLFLIFIVSSLRYSLWDTRGKEKSLFWKTSGLGVLLMVQIASKVSDVFCAFGKVHYCFSGWGNLSRRYYGWLEGAYSCDSWDLHSLWHSSFQVLMWKVLRKRAMNAFWLQHQEHMNPIQPPLAVLQKWLHSVLGYIPYQIVLWI